MGSQTTEDAIERKDLGKLEATNGPKPKPPKKSVSMSVMNFWLDGFILFQLLLVGCVTAILQFVFPAPSLSAGWRLWKLTYDQWRDIQFASLCAFTLGIIVHVMLHWNWVCSVVATQVLHSRARPDEGSQTIYGVLLLIALLHILGICVIIAMFCVHRPPTP